MKSWQPTASITALKDRALFLQKIRRFFEERNILEVETPLLCHAAVQDPHLHPIPALYQAFGQASQTMYLQTSPEFAMKRLLASGIGPIYQLCKAFRNGESGRLHNPEFTILEWYQPGYDHHRLMDEVELFLNYMLNDAYDHTAQTTQQRAEQKAERITYQDLFLKFLEFDPFQVSHDELKSIAKKNNIHLSTEHEPSSLSLSSQDSLSPTASFTRDDWLNLLLTHCIEPHLGFKGPLMVYDYPDTQAALAKIRTEAQGFKVGERFEVYLEGMELANGYHELTHGELQEQRFLEDAEMRQVLNHPSIPIDRHLISALKAGMPECAGVALGVDRLLMLKQKSKDIREILAFTIDNA